MSGPNGDPAHLFGFGQARADEPALDTDTFIDRLARLFGAWAAEPRDVLIRDWRFEGSMTPPTQPVSDGGRLLDGDC